MSVFLSDDDPDGSEEFVFEGDITDYWSYTQIRDYVLLMHGLSHTALRLYLLLRSMIKEHSKGRPRGGLRRMTIDQLCWLLPGPEGKAISVSAMYGFLAALDQLDLVVASDQIEAPGAAKLKGKEKAACGILRGFVVKDLPPATHSGWRNVWDKLDAYTPDWRTTPPEAPTHLTTYGSQDEDGRRVDRVQLVTTDGQPFQKTGTPCEGDQEASAFQKTGTVFQETGTVVQIPGTDLALTCENEPLKEAPLRSSLSSPAPRASQRRSPGTDTTKTREKKAAPTKTQPAPPKAQAGLSAEALTVVEAWVKARRSSGHPVTSDLKARISATAESMLTRSDEPADPARLVAVAADLGKVVNWLDLEKHYGRAAVTVPGQRSSLPDWCGKCNRGEEPSSPAMRLLELEDGRDVFCPACHPRAALTAA
ncbi:hypothetical protein ABT095_33580 [Kitasatospora sp. NPDC002227]|uniref:hypothetical protein n=1 Tax=Kitasatospora sp. NPDC002227 TaxID=3154773 RepID=UPI0033298230